MPKTDWDLVRTMMEAAIGACEEIEAMGYREAHRDLGVQVGGQPVSVYEFMVSAWTLPETMRYRIIRARHDAGADLPCVPEFARILVAMAQAGAELVGAKDAAPAEAEVRQMIAWYREHALPRIRDAIEKNKA
jgi:hypothetical protein